MKKLLTLGLSIVIALSVFTVPPIGADAVGRYCENGFYFELGEDNKATVTGTDSDDVHLYIPGELENGYQVNAVGDEAFKGNLKIQSVHCDADLERIGDYAFEDCTHMISADFSGSVGTIGKGAFSTCSSLTEVNLNKNVKSISDGAFFFDKKLRSFGFPKNLESVGEYAFAFCGLTNVIMNNKIKTVPDRLFYGCNELQNIALPKNLETIGDYAFTNCEKLDIDDLPAKLDKVGKYAFKGCGLSSVAFSGSEIGEGAFSRLSDSVDKLSFTDNLKKVGKLAFENDIIQSVELPDNLSLENGAFSGIDTKEYSVKETNDNYICSDGIVFTKDNKTLVSYPKSRGYDAESGEDEPEYVYTIPTGIETVAPYAFYGANALTGIEMPDTLKAIGDYAFYGASLDGVKLADSVKEVGKYAFAGVANARSLDLGSVEKLGNLAFFNFSQEAVTVRIPDTLKTFNVDAFAAQNIKFEVENNYKVVDGALYSADGKTLLCVPKETDSTFTIPDGVEEIAYRAFALNTDAMVIEVPQSVKSVGKQAFEYYVDYSQNYEDLQFKDGLRIVGNVSGAVKQYADDHNIGVFTQAPAQNIKSVTLKGKETADFVISGADTSDIVYSSNNDRIASVSDSGKITALSKGTTYVTAAVGTTYFKTKVVVTSDSGIKYNGFDDSNYYRVTPKTYELWRENYLKNNRYLVENYDSVTDEPAMGAYQSEDFYTAMDGVTYDGSNFYQMALQSFGPGFEPMISILNHSCNTELSRHKNTDSLILYSGAEPYASRMIAGENNTLKNLRKAKGTTFTHPEYISTSLSPNVANNFYSKGEGVVYIIYAEKEALDNATSGLIAAMHSDFEYEQLLAPGCKFEVIDAGVRWFENSEWKDDTDEKVSGYQRYVKLRLLGGKDAPAELPAPEIKLSRTPKSMYLKQTGKLKYSFVNTYDRKAAFTSSNPKVAKISKSGKLTALKKGTTTITVSNSETKTAFMLTVKNPTLNKKKLTLTKGKRAALKIKGKVGTAKFTIKNKKIATVSKKGVVKAKQNGSTTITVKTNGITLKCKVKVK